MSMSQNILAANEMLSKSTVDLQPQLEQGLSLGRKPSSSRILDTKRIQKSWVSHCNPSSIINTGFIPAFKDGNDDANGSSISSVMSPHAIASFEHSNRKLRTYKRLEELCSENEILQTQITSSGQCREDDFKLGHCFSQGRIHANLYDGHIGHAGHDGHNDNADSIHDHSKNENVPMRSMSALAFANTFENQAIVAPEYPNIFRRDFLCGTYTQHISGIIDPHNIKSSEIEVSPLKSNKHTTRKDYRFPDDERNGAGNSFGNRSYVMPRPPSIDERSWIQTQQPYPVVSVSAIRSALAHSRSSISARVSASMPMSKHMKPHRNKFPSSNNITFARYIPAVALPCTRAVADVDDYNDNDLTTDGADFSRMHVMQGYPSDHGEDGQSGSFGSDKESSDERQGSDDDQQDSEGQGNAGEGSDDSGSGEDNDSDENKDKLDGDDDEDDDEGEDEDEDEDEDDNDDCNDNNVSSLHRAKGGFYTQFATDSTCVSLSVQRSYSTPLRRNQYRSTSSSSTQSPTSPSLFRDITTAPQSLASTSSDSASRSLYASFRLQPQRQSNLSTPTDDPRRQFQDEFLANVSAAGLEVDASGYEVRRSSRRSSRRSMTSTSQPTQGQIDMDIAREASRSSMSPQPLLEPVIEESKKQMIMDTTMGGTDFSMQQLLENTARKRTRDESFQEPTTGRNSNATRRPITLPSFREFLEMSSKPPPPLHNSVRPRIINSRFGSQLMGPSIQHHQQCTSSNGSLPLFGFGQQQSRPHLYSSAQCSLSTSSRQRAIDRTQVWTQAAGQIQPGRQLPPYKFGYITAQADFGNGYVRSPGIADPNPSWLRDTLDQRQAPGGIGNRQHHGEDQRQGQSQTHGQDRHYNCSSRSSINHGSGHSRHHVHGSRDQGHNQWHGHGHINNTGVDQLYDQRRGYGHNSYGGGHGYIQRQQFNYNSSSPGSRICNLARVYENNNNNGGEQRYNRSHGYDNSVSQVQVSSQGNSHDSTQSQTRGQGQGQGQGRSSQRSIPATFATSDHAHSTSSTSDPASDLANRGPSQDNIRDAQCTQEATTTNKRCSRRARHHGRCYQHQD